MHLIHLIRKHRRKLVVTGAATVFFTFIVKDGLRDNAKDGVTAIEKATQAYSDALRQENDRLTLMSILSAVTQQGEIHVKDDQLTVSGLWAKRDQLQFQVETMDVVQAVDDLKAVLPPDKEMDRRENEVKENKDKLDSAQAMLMYQVGLSKDWSHVETESQELAGNDARVAHDKTLLALTDLWLQVNADADTERKSRARRYKVFTWISYALFTLGWSLGLIGEFTKEEKQTIGTSSMDPNFEPNCS